MKKEKIISFPHLGNYYVPISYLINNLTNIKVMIAPRITKKTIELGSKYSPDLVCLPFKYNLGNFIEALEKGANILFQAGGGCRYGCYGELQEKMLKELGYDFEFISLSNDENRITINSIYRALRKINNKISYVKYIRYLFLTILMIKYMDLLDDFVRKNMGFEINNGDFNKLIDKSLREFSKKKNVFSLTKTFIKYKKLLKKVPLNKPVDPLRIGIIGELFTNMETYSSCFLEKTLASMNVSIKRFTNLSYLLYEKAIFKKFHLYKLRKELKYTIGADGMDNVYRCKYLIKNKYDAIVHIKPFGCTPEIGAIPIIDKICKENKMPIIYFSFDNQNSDEAIKTRLEALVDMLNERRRNK